MGITKSILQKKLYHKDYYKVCKTYLITTYCILSQNHGLEQETVNCTWQPRKTANIWTKIEDDKVCETLLNW